MKPTTDTPTTDTAEATEAVTSPPQPEPQPKKEVGGPKGPDPTRYGDWERNGRCIDF